MPIFDLNGKKYDVEDKYLDAFSKQNPDAYTIEEREGKRYKVRAKDYGNFRTHFDKPQQEAIQQPEDDSVFEANAERFRNGQPIERVNTQSVIDANPELELGDQPYQYKPEVQQHILQNKPDMFKPKQSLMDAPLGVNAPEGSDEKFQARIDIAQKNLQDPEYQKGKVKSEFRVLSDSVNADLEKIEDAITSRQKAVRNTDWKPGMPSSRDDAKLSELRGQRTYLEGAKELIEDSQNILNAVEAEKDGSFFGGLGRGVRDKAFDIDTWTMGLSDLVGGLRLKSVLEKAEKGEELTPAEEKLLDASVNNMAVNFYYRNDLGLGYQAGEITGQSIPFMLEFLVNPVSASGNAMAKRLLTYGLKRFGSAVNNKAIKAGTRLATDALAAGGVTASTGMGHVLSGGVERLNRNYEYGLDEEGNLNVVNTHNMGVGEAFAKSATSAFLERQSEMIFNAFRGAPSLFKGIETSLPGGVNTFMNYVSNSRLGELWRGIKNNATMKELAKRTQFHGLGEEYLEEVYNNFANIPLGEMTFEEATDLENNIVTFLGLAPTQVMFSAIGGIGYGVERYKAKKDLERTFGKMTEEQKRKLIELQEMGKLSTNKDIAFFLAETIKDESLTPEQKRAEIEYAYNLAKQNAIDEVSNTDVEDSIESENQQIDAATDPQTGMYGEVMLTSQDLDGNNVVTQANVFGEKEVNGELYLLVLPEGEAEKKWVRPNQYDVNSYQKRPAEEVKAINEEMIREEAAQQAEQEAKYAPEVLNAQMQQGVPFDTPNAQIVPVAPMPEGNGWIVEEYALDTNNKVAKTPIVRELTNDEYRDMLQAQLNAEEAAQEQISAEEQAAAPEVVEEVQPTEEVDVKENLTTESRDNLSPVEEVAQPQVEVKPQTPVIPTKEDGSIDFVSYGKEGTFKTLGEKYGEKMPNKVAVTAKALAEDLKKAQNKLQKAEEAYDNAPIGREQKAEEARYKAKQELEAIQREANFWAEMDAEIKDAQARRESMLNPQAEVETSTEPMNVDEFVAQQLASGNIVLDKEDYKKETGYGDVEANAMNGGATKLFGKNGMTIQEAGERLMEIDRENGTNFFDQLDSNSGRDALINVLGSVKSRNELNQYIATNRAEQAKKESEGLRNELEKQAMEANYASLEDYVLQMEAAEMENPFLNDRADEIMAIFAEEAAKYEQSLNNTENGQGTENEVVEGNDSILPEEQLDNTGGTEVSEESERIGDGTSEESESTHAATEVELKQEEGETTLQFAERAAEENRRRPLRKRAEEWSNTLGIKVTYLESIDDVDAKTRAQIEAAHAKGESVPGWVNKKGEVFFFMPDLSDLKDVDDTYIHEVVAHVGLPQLLGKERFGELCDKVWDMMPQSAKDYYMSYPGVKNHRDAADEYIAHLAEQQNLTPEERTIWDNIVKMFREMLDKALNGIISKSKLTDEDISNLIKASYANLKSGAEGNVSGESTKFRAKWRKGQLDKASRTIRRWLENNTRGKSFEIELPKATLDKVRKAMGRDFESHNITSNGIVHALKNHGENGLKLTGISIPLSKEDVELIPYIMTSPDRVEKASTDASGRESVRFYKDLSNGYVVVVEKEYKNSPDDMETITMWAELSSKATNAQQNAAPDTHVRNAILSIDIAKIRKDAEDAIEEDENLKEKTSFRVVKDKNGNKSLVGLHNISEAKLKKAIKQGGLANPSMAVIDMDKQSHVDYGDITLVAPSSLVDKKTGKNIGTYTADAWTPIYPNIEKRMSDKGAKAYSESLESVPSELRNKVRLYFNAYLEDGNTSGALNYWFLHDTGKNPPSLTSQSNDYTNEELDAIEAISNAGYYSGLNEEEKQKVLDLFIEKQGGKDAFDAKIAERIETMKNNLQRPDLKTFLKNKVEQKLQEIQEYGYDYEQVSNFYSNAQRAINNRGKIDEFRTFRNAQDIVNNEGLQGEFNEWLADKEEQFGVEEYIFVGYNNNGDRKYLPNTLENASKLMKKEGRAGATGLHGFNHFVATLAPNAGTLAQINKKKGNLSTQEEYDAFREKWGDVYHELAKQLQPDATGYADYGYYRLEDMPTVKNPKEYVKEEYGIELSDEFMKKYNEFVSAIKNDFPARYFETKFERPVYLNEFAAAVVPQGTSKDVLDALTGAGLPIEEYESGNNEARMAAVDKVSSEMEGVRFRVKSFETANEELDKDGISINNKELMDEYGLSDITLSKSGNHVTLSKVVVKDKGQGNGTRFMEDLTNNADNNGWILALTPDTSFGGSSLARLKKFYKRFGFKDNKGRNTDFETRESMVRPVGGTRFRLSEKGKQIQAEVDKFTSKYNSKPVRIVEAEMDDNELMEALDYAFELEDVKSFMKESKTAAGYFHNLDKIIIFADKTKVERMEEYLFHENIHAAIHHNNFANLVAHFYEYAKNEAVFEKWSKLAHNKEYKQYNSSEEFLAYVVSNAMVARNLDEVAEYLGDKQKKALNKLFNVIGYDYDIRRRSDEQSVNGRTSEETSGESSLEGNELLNTGEGRGTGEGIGKGKSRKVSAAERKERLNELFTKVADMGLQGVLGNKEYTSLMVDIYKALPEGVRAEIAEDALRLYGGSVAPAVSDYIGPKSKNSIMDKVVTIVREALRKVGFDLDLNANEVRYMAWRSKKPLDRSNMLEVAEDIDMKYRLKVGEYDGTTPDGGGTRFRNKEPEKIDIADKRSPIIKKYDETLKTGMFNFQEAFQDRMLSLKVLMDVIVGSTGKKAKSFEDAYEAENQLSSTNKVDQERYIKKFYTPLVEYLKEISKKHGEEIVRRYIYCKSGLERNEVLRQRDADEAFNAAKEELDEKLAKNQLTQAQYDALLQQAEDQRVKTLSEDVDYSGIRGMLFNVRSQELFEQYQSGALTEAQYKQKIEELKNKKADVVKNWKDFAIISVADLENRATSAELDELWSKINAATNETLRIDFESGMIDRETYEAEKNMMKYYVPLRDWENTKAEEMYEYRHDMTPAVSSNQKKAKGRESEAANPIATIALMAQNAIVRGNRNKMKQKLYSFVVNRPNDLASVRNVWYVRDANNQWEPQYANTSAASNQEEANQIIEQFEANMEVLAAQGDAFKGKLKQGMGYRASRKQKDEHVVAVMINGKEYGVYINGNPRAAQAVNGLTNAENVDDGYAWIDNLKRLYGGSLTSWDPNFVVPNFVRDTIHASTMTFLDRGVLGAVQYMANIPKIFAQVSAEISGLSIGNAKLHQYFEEFVNNGGETGYTEVHTLEDYKKEYQKLMNEAKGLKAGIKKGLKLPFQKMAKVLETANRIAEDVNRFNAYVTSRESGENIVNSIDAAKNITVNFNRKGALHANSSVYGKVASFMSRWILFFNPSVQGIYQLVSKSKMNPKRATALGATIIASGFFMPLLNEMLVSAFGGGDEDDYWNQSDFKRRNNWMLFTGDGYVSIPLPPVFREIYGMGDIIYGVMTGHIPPQRAIYDVLNQVQSAIGFVTLLPEVSQEPDVTTWLKGFAPDLTSPFLDVMSNTNFMGRPIAKWTDYNESDPEHERVYKGVGKHWVGLSELLNEVRGNETRRSDWWGNMINPAMMEHLVTSYTGGIGKTINNLAGMAIDAVEGDTENMDVFRKSPIIPRFYTPNDEKTVYPGINRKFYEFEYQYNNAKKSLKKSQDGVNSGEHPEWQKYIDEMDKNGEKKFIEYFKKEQKKLKKLQDKLKEDPNNKGLEKQVYDKKAEISAESFKILSGQK